MKIRCTCGAVLSVAQGPTEKRVRCPKCGSVHSVPAAAAPEQGVPAASASEQGVPAASAPEPGVPAAPGKVCPGCGKALARNAVVCVACGYDVRTGKKLSAAGESTRVIPPAPPEPPASKARFLIYAGVLVAVIAAGVIYSLTQKPEPPEPPKSPSTAPATAPDAVREPTTPPKPDNTTSSRKPSPAPRSDVKGTDGPK